MARVIEDDAGITELLHRVKTIAVLGIKTEAQAGQPSFSVPQYMQRQGYDVIPVPVYYPNVKEILGRPVFRKLVEIPGPVDLVNVFRRSQDVGAHLPDILAKKPRAVWLQLGIRDDVSAQKLVEAGIDVVQNKCLMVEHRLHA